MERDGREADETPAAPGQADVRAETGLAIGSGDRPGQGAGAHGEQARQDTHATVEEGGSPGDEGGEDPECFASDVIDARQRRTGSMRTSTVVVLVCLVILVALTVLGSVLNVGDHLMDANVVLGTLFYVLVGVVVVVGVVRPVIEVSRRPVFSLYQLRDEHGRAKRRHCRMLVDNLVNNAGLTPAQKSEVEGYLLAGDEADDLLIDFFKRTCVPQIDAECRRSATTAFFATAISHSALVDTVTMLSVCLELVRSIVQRCGFRPTNLGLARLYSRVMLSALIAGGLDDADLDGLMGQALGGGAGARGAGILLGSATSGMVSAFLTFRVGVITRDWLCSEDGPARMASIRRVSYGEALSMMRTSGFLQEVAGAVKRAAASAAGDVASAARSAAKGAAESTVAPPAEAAHPTPPLPAGIQGRVLRRRHGEG